MRGDNLENNINTEDEKLNFKTYPLMLLLKKYEEKYSICPKCQNRTNIDYSNGEILFKCNCGWNQSFTE